MLPLQFCTRNGGSTPQWLTRLARLSAKAGRQGGVAGLVVAGRVGRRAGWGVGPGGVAGRVGWRSGWSEGDGSSE